MRVVEDMGIEFRPIGTENWLDFEALMESRGAPHGCWCTAWLGGVTKAADKSEKKAAMKARAGAGIPIGLLAYVAGEPIGWCAVAPRETYRNLGGDASKARVWSVVCFFITRKYRGQGLSTRFLGEAVGYAQAQGARFIEGYPVAPDAPSYKFMGFMPLFEKAGFEYVKPAGTRRNVMLRALE